MKAVPIFGLLVANALEDISAFKRVAELKKVVLPTFVFPMSPSLIITTTYEYDLYILSVV